MQNKGFKRDNKEDSRKYNIGLLMLTLPMFEDIEAVKIYFRAKNSHL